MKLLFVVLILVVIFFLFSEIGSAFIEILGFFVDNFLVFFIGLALVVALFGRKT